MQFYKYTTAQTAGLIIRHAKLRWSTPQVLNDPFDMQFAFQLAVDHETAKRMALDKIWNHHYGEPLDRPLNKLGRLIQRLRGRFQNPTRDDFEKVVGPAIDRSYDHMKRKMTSFNLWVQSVFEKDKIFCVSDQPDNILMWSYYSQNHSGIVLRFDSEVKDSPLSQARPVTYVERMPSLFDNELFSDLLAGYQAVDASTLITLAAFSKSNHWTHESEWRVYAGRGRTSQIFEDIPFNPQELTGVIFGARTAPKVRRSLTETLKTFYPNVTIYEAIKLPDEYGLSIEVAEENILQIPLRTKIILLAKILLERAPGIFRATRTRLMKKISRWSDQNR